MTSRAMDRANEMRLREIRQARAEIEAAEALPAWAYNPRLLTAVLQDPKRTLAAVAAMKAMCDDPATLEPERLVLQNLILDIEQLS